MPGLSISKEEYEEIYYGIDVPDYSLFESSPVDPEDLWSNYMVVNCGD